MPVLQQLPDSVIIFNDDGSYGADRAQFEVDHGKPLPPLPDGITARVYEPGVYHALKSGDSVVDGGPMPWPEGDELLAKNKSMVKKQKDREDAKEAAARQKVENEVKAINDEIDRKNQQVREEILRRGGPKPV